MGRGARIVLVAMACSLLAAGFAVADDSVPLPTPAPRPKSTAAPPVAATSALPDTAAASAAATPADPGAKGLFPFAFSLGKSAVPSQAIAFDAHQRALLDKISNYLSGVQTLVGNFVQIGPDGR